MFAQISPTLWTSFAELPMAGLRGTLGG